MSDALGNPIHAAPATSSSRRVRVAAAVVWRDGRLLFTQRPPGGPLGLQWEFPGGKLEPGETPQRAVVRELEEELGVTATALDVVGVEDHRYAHGLEVEITFVRCTLDRFDFRPSAAVHALAWWSPAEVDLEAVLAADRGFIGRLRARA